MNKVLVFGKNSFVASGIESELLKGGFDVDFFSRGSEGRKDNIIYGQSTEILKNAFFDNEYHAVINYVVLKDKDVKENIEFIQQLLEFCLAHKVKKLIHFSSIMVYDYAAKQIDESSSIEQSTATFKKGYGEIKIAVDEYLQSVKHTYPFEIILVRPGYVLDLTRSCPFVKNLPLGFNLIKGNKKSKQPIVMKESIHKALLKILSMDTNDPVYHFFPDTDQTKYQFAKEKFGGKVLIMPELIFKTIPLLFTKIGILPKSVYSRFEGMYIKTVFRSKSTEQKLQIKF